MNRFSNRTGLLLAALICPMISMGPSIASAQDRTLTIASFGGAYARSQIMSYVDPFRQETGRWIEMVDYDGGLEELEEQTLALNVKWDIVDIMAADAIRGCQDGLLERLDGVALAPSPSGVPATEDFLSGLLLPCAIGQNIWATVIAYDKSAYKGTTAPANLKDFFDLERFPGSRGLQKSPRVNLEWALLADGVAPDEVYSVLETDEGLERALAMLERIRPSIVWWTTGTEPIRLLRGRRVAMSSVWNGRIFFHNQTRAEPYGTIWDGNVWEREYWAIPKGSPNAEVAKAFIGFATEAKRQAAQANQIAYSPARRSAISMVESDVLPFLPTAPENAQRGFPSNADWWARNGDRLETAFLDWADGKKKSYNSTGN